MERVLSSPKKAVANKPLPLLKAEFFKKAVHCAEREAQYKREINHVHRILGLVYGKLNGSDFTWSKHDRPFINSLAESVLKRDEDGNYEPLYMVSDDDEKEVLQLPGSDYDPSKDNNFNRLRLGATRRMGRYDARGMYGYGYNEPLDIIPRGQRGRRRGKNMGVYGNDKMGNGKPTGSSFAQNWSVSKPDTKKMQGDARYDGGY